MLLLTRINLHPDPSLPHLSSYLLSIVQHSICDRHDAALHRRQPQWKGASTVFYKNPKKALNRAKDGSMHHDWLLLLIPLICICLQHSSGRLTTRYSLSLSMVQKTCLSTGTSLKAARRRASPRELAWCNCLITDIAMQQRSKDTHSCTRMFTSCSRRKVCNLNPRSFSQGNFRSFSRALHMRHHLEPLRQVEVELNGAALPFAPQHILYLDIDLGPIEGSPTLINLVVPALQAKGLPKGSLGLFPDLWTAYCLGRLCRQVDFQLCEAQSAHDVFYHVEHASDLGSYLVRQAEDVAIILHICNFIVFLFLSEKKKGLF